MVDEIDTVEHFPAAMAQLLGIEKGFINDERDRGGATKYGLSLRFLVELAARDASWLTVLDADGDRRVTSEDVKRMSPELARAVYRTEFWEKYRCGKLPHPAGGMFFSYVVNMTPEAAALVLQRAVNRAAGHAAIREDGVVGPKTIAAAGKCRVDELCKRLDAEASAHYGVLARRQPYYGDGWQYRSADALWWAALQFAGSSGQ